MLGNELSETPPRDWFPFDPLLRRRSNGTEFTPVVKLSGTTRSYCFTFMCFIFLSFFLFNLATIILRHSCGSFIRFWAVKWKRLIHIIARLWFQSHKWQWVCEVFHSNAKTIITHQMEHWKISSFSKLHPGLNMWLGKKRFIYPPWIMIIVVFQ